MSIVSIDSKPNSFSFSDPNVTDCCIGKNVQQWSTTFTILYYHYLITCSLSSNILNPLVISHWSPPEFREAIKCRQKAFSHGNIAQYHRLKTVLNSPKLHKTYFSSKVDQLYSSNTRQWWLKSRHILKMEDPNPLANVDYQVPALLAETVRNSFTEVSSHLPKVDSTISANLRDDHNADFIVDLSEIENGLASINIYKALGPDGLPSWFLRDLAPCLSQPLGAIFNASDREGYFPPVWKAAEVIPVPKVPKPRSIQTDLRPISLLPCLAKIF